jgi:hypothetical protein
VGARRRGESAQPHRCIVPTGRLSAIQLIEGMSGVDPLLTVASVRIRERSSGKFKFSKYFAVLAGSVPSRTLLDKTFRYEPTTLGSYLVSLAGSIDHPTPTLRDQLRLNTERL